MTQILFDIEIKSLLVIFLLMKFLVFRIDSNDSEEPNKWYKKCVIPQFEKKTAIQI